MLEFKGRIVMRTSMYVLLLAISIAVFACSDSPSSIEEDDFSSSSLERGGNVITISSSSGISGSVEPISSSSSVLNGKVCIFSGEEFGFSGIFGCEEYSDTIDLQAQKTECEGYGGIWEIQCPIEEKIICMDDENEEAKGMTIKIYAEGFVCEDFGLKNADGSENIVSKGGACGPFAPVENVSFSMCTEFSELPTGTIKLSCAELEAPFVNNCPSSNLACYNPEDDIIIHFYGEEMSSSKCQDFNMDDMM